MDNQCNHILLKGQRKGERCTRIAWFPMFYRCFCKQHALINNIPITKGDIDLFISNNT